MNHPTREDTMSDLDRCHLCLTDPGDPDDDDRVFVIVCGHVLAADPGDETEITVTAGLPEDIPRHDCGHDDCPEFALCGHHWSNL